MENCDSRREENYQEYLRLKQDPHYYDVTFDEQSSGVSAIHREHCFDKQFGPFGSKRGDYELSVSRILRSKGYVITLESEYPKGRGVKSFDAFIDGAKSEIKTVESNGRWSIRTKIQSAVRQRAELLVLYYPKKELYSELKIYEGLDLVLQSIENANLKKIIAIVEEAVKILKPPG